jgi:hypothetical protein
MNTKNPKNTSEIVESLRAAAARIGVELHQVKTAKRDGCPAFRPGGRVHLDQLKTWFAAKASTAIATPLPPLNQEEMEALGTIEASLQSAIRDEVESGRLLQRARETGDTAAVADLSRAVSVARKARLVAEAEVMNLRLERAQLVTVFEHQRLLNSIWPPLINQLRALPRSIAPRLAGMEVDKIDQTLTGAIEAALAETKKALAENTADHHLDVWIDGELEADPSGARMRQKIDQLLVDLPKIIEVTAAINKRRNPENENSQKTPEKPQSIKRLNRHPGAQKKHRPSQKNIGDRRKVTEGAQTS